MATKIPAHLTIPGDATSLAEFRERVESATTRGFTLRTMKCVTKSVENVPDFKLAAGEAILCEWFGKIETDNVEHWALIREVKKEEAKVEG